MNEEPASTSCLSGFVMAPVAMVPRMDLWQCDLYLWAYEQAQAVVEMSWIERDIMGTWN